MSPILSICIPTYNRAHLLRVMLEALLPQSELLNEKVEVIVADNASTDETDEIVKQYQKKYTLAYSKNAKNEGVIANIVKCPLELAKGEFIWILGDHNLLSPNALEYLIPILESKKKLDILYANFKCAKYPEQWPESAKSGYEGAYDYINDSNVDNSDVKTWKNLVSDKTALCTQLYAHIIKTNIWKNYWNNRVIPEVFMNAIGTYPHSYMISETVFNSPSYYIGKPLLTIYNGAQHWKGLDLKAMVYFNGLPELISSYKASGLEPSKIKDAIEWNKRQVKQICTQINKEENAPTLSTLLGKNQSSYLRATIIQTYLATSNQPLALRYRSVLNAIQSIKAYFTNWRPARYFRKISR